MRDDTRAVARLSNLEIEVRRRRRAPDEGAEHLSVSLRATPDLDAVARWLDPFAYMRAWASPNPWLAPWWGVAAAPSRPLVTTERR